MASDDFPTEEELISTARAVQATAKIHDEAFESLKARHSELLERLMSQEDLSRAKDELRDERKELEHEKLNLSLREMSINYRAEALAGKLHCEFLEKMVYKLIHVIECDQGG